MLYSIESIEEKKYIGMNKTHNDILFCTCEIVRLVKGSNGILDVYYRGDKLPTAVQTSVIEDIEDMGYLIVLTTENSIYNLWRIE